MSSRLLDLQDFDIVYSYQFAVVVIRVTMQELFPEFYCILTIFFHRSYMFELFFFLLFLPTMSDCFTLN